MPEAPTVPRKPTVLFLSAIDFKEKSIQVIRKTPEAFARSGWRVLYVVSRDDSRYGDYYYEGEIDPDGVEVYRHRLPFTHLYDRIPGRLARLLLARIRLYWGIGRMAVAARRLTRRNAIDVVYGYEIHGVLAASLLRLLTPGLRAPRISRFQGTRVNEVIATRNPLRILASWEALVTAFIPADLCIVTDDGTAGDKAFARLRTRNLKNFRFWVNGVDEQRVSDAAKVGTRQALGIQAGAPVVLTICRLVGWKRVDRVIEVVARLVNDFGHRDLRYVIVGEGTERASLEARVATLGIAENVIFAGAVKNADVSAYLGIADLFFSTYDLSNVGNPLLEAIRAERIIFTLNNGDTSRWIRHGENGFIFDVTEDLCDRMAAQADAVLKDSALRERIRRGVAETAHNQLWTWAERMDAEVEAASELVAAPLTGSCRPPSECSGRPGESGSRTRRGNRASADAR